MDKRAKSTNNIIDSEINIKQEDGSFITIHPITKESNIVVDEGKTPLRECKFDDVDIYYDESRELNVMDFYADGKIIKTVEFVGGAGSIKSGAITSTIPSRFSINEGDSIVIPFVFDSPNKGEATLYISVLCGEKSKELEYTIKRVGAGSVNIGTVDKGINEITFYVIDSLGQMTNAITFNVVCGSIEINSTFDDNQDFNIYASISIPFILSSLDKNAMMTLSANIDGDVYTQQANEGYNSFNFPNDKKVVGVHHVILQVISDDFNSNVLEYNVVIVDNTQILLSTKDTSLIIEEGNDVKIDYRISTIGQNVFNVVYELNGEIYKEQGGILGVNTFIGVYSDFPKGNHTLRITATNSDGTMTGYLDIAINIIENSFKRIDFVRPGMQVWFNMSRKTNQDNDKDVLLSEVMTDTGRIARLKLHDYNYSTNGWIDGKLVNNGISWAEIENYIPLEDNAPNGFTFEIQFTSFNAGDNNAKVVNCIDDNTGYGFFIDSEKANFMSESNKLKTFYTDRTDMRVSFVVNRTSTYIDKNGVRQNNPMLQTFINGMFTEVAMLSDSGSGANRVLESVTSNSSILINTDKLKEVFGSNEIKTILIYNRPLEHEEILQNLMADIDNLAEQKRLYDKNYVTINQDLPTMYFNDTEIGNHATMTKDIKQWINIVYVSPDKDKYGPSFDYICQTSWQGTSSLQYPVKNYKFKTYEYETDENGNPINTNDPDTFKKVKIDMYGARDGNGYKENTFCLKADYMDSSHCRNTGTARLVNDFLFDGHPNPAKQKDPMTRDTINGFPIQLYVNGEWYGVYNFNHDKSCTKTLGLETCPNTVRWEIKANSNTSEGAFYKTWEEGNITDIYKKILSDFEIVYDEDAFGSWEIVEDELILEDDATGEYDVTKYYDELNIPYEGETVIGNYRDYAILSFARFIQFVSDVEDREEYRARAQEYFDVKQACRYYLNVLTLGMIDNFAKNCIVNMYGDDVWWFSFYDMDSSLGLDNTGYNKFETNIEPSQPNIYNCATSKMWVKLNDWMPDKLFDEFKIIREGKYTYENICKYLIETQIDIIPQIAYNRDMYAKYISQGRQYLHMLHGNNKDHLLRWLYNRFQYVDSLFLQQNSPYTKESITIRSNKPSWVPANERYTARFEIETYCPQYVTVCWRKNTYETKRIDFNETVVFENEMVNDTDNELIVYCAGNLKRIGDCTNLRPTSIDIGFATRLVEFKCENSDVLLKADLSKNAYLKEVSFNGCSQMGNTTGGANVLDVSKCTNLRKVDVRGTQITSVLSNVNGGNLEEILYSDVTQSIVLSKQTNLRTIGIPYGFDNIWGGLSNISVDRGFTLNYDNETDIFSKQYNPDGFVISRKGKNDNGENISKDNLWEIRNNDIELILPVDGTSFDIFFFDIDKNFISKNSVKDTNVHTDTKIVGVQTPLNAKYCIISLSFNSKMISRLKDFGVVKKGNTEFKLLPNLTNVQISNCSNVKALDLYSGLEPNDVLFKALYNTQTLSLDNSLILETLNFEGFGKLRNISMKNMFDLKEITFDDMINNYDVATLYNVSFTNCTLIKNITMNVSSNDYAIRFAENSLLDLSGLTSLETISSNYYIKGLKKIILPIQLKSMIFSGEYGDGYNSITDLWSIDAVGDHLNDEYTGIDFKNIELEDVDLLGITGISNGMNFSIKPINRNPNLNTNRDGSPLKPWFRPSGKIDITEYSEDMKGMFKGIDTTKIDIVLDAPIKYQKDLSGLFENAIIDNISIVNNIISKFSEATNLDYILQNVTSLTSITGIQLPTGSRFSLYRGFSGCIGLTEDILFPSNVVDVREAFRGCTGIKKLHSNWDNEYDIDGDLMFGNCYMNCINVDEIDGEVATLNDVPRLWGGYGFDESVTLIADISTYAAGSRTIRISDSEGETIHMYTNWGDGCIDDKFVHTYSSDGVYSIQTQKISTMGYRFATSFKESIIKISQTPMDCKYYEYLFEDCKHLESAEFTINDETTSLLSLFDGCEGLEYVNINLPKNCNNLNYTFRYCQNLTNLDFVSEWDLTEITTMRETFNGCRGLTSLDVSSWNMENVTTIYGLFQNCEYLEELDVSLWNVENVRSMGYVFAGCLKLANLDVSKWVVTNCTEFDKAFQGCESITELGIGEWDVSNGKTFGFMLQRCNKLTTLDLSGWNMDNATSIISLFQNCSGLVSIDVSGWNMPKCSTASYTFNGCSNLLSIDLSTWKLPSVTSLASTFSGCLKLETIALGDWSDSKIQSLNGFCQNCNNLTEISNIDKLNTSRVTNLNSVFQGCDKLRELPIGNWVVDKVTNMGSLFSGCKALKTLDLSSWNVGKVIDMTYIFYECLNLDTLNLTGWITTNLQRMYSAFQNCTKLTSLDVSKWVLTNVKDLNCVFQNCSMLTSLDLTGWDLSSVRELGSLFQNCSSLTELKVSNWVTTNVTNASYIFYNCKSLAELDLSGWDLSKCVDDGLYYAFISCEILGNLIPPKNINCNVTIPEQSNRENLVNILVNLMDRTAYSPLTITLGEENINKLTEDDILIAINKNWSVV